MSNYLREVRNQVRAINREKEHVMQAMEAGIYAAFDAAEGQEQVRFRFDAFNLWGLNKPKAENIEEYLREQDLITDNWFRGVFRLTKEQALALGRLVIEWNQDWTHNVTHDMKDYNAFSIEFGPATGTEHLITVGTGGRYTTEAWQWN